MERDTAWVKEVMLRSAMGVDTWLPWPEELEQFLKGRLKDVAQYLDIEVFGSGTGIHRYPHLYLSPHGFANLIGRSTQHIQSLCKQGKIDGARQSMISFWCIPVQTAIDNYDLPQEAVDDLLMAEYIVKKHYPYEDLDIAREWRLA